MQQLQLFKFKRFSVTVSVYVLTKHIVALFALVLILFRNPTVGRSYDTIQTARVRVCPPPRQTGNRRYIGRHLLYLQSLDKLVSSSVNVLDAKTGHRRHRVVTSSSRANRRRIVRRTTTFDYKGTHTVRARSLPDRGTVTIWLQVP